MNQYWHCVDCKEHVKDPDLKSCRLLEDPSVLKKYLSGKNMPVFMGKSQNFTDLVEV